MLNENIKSLRKQNGLSQEQLANEMHVVRQTVSKWERGLSVPDSDSLIKLSEILHTSVSVLLGGNVVFPVDGVVDFHLQVFQEVFFVLAAIAFGGVAVA